MKEMTNLLVDMHTLDGIFATYDFHHLTAGERDQYYEAILEKHRTNQAQFDSSLVWYNRDPKRFEKVYVRVINRLTAELEAVKAAKIPPIIPAPIALESTELLNDTTFYYVLRNDSLVHTFEYRLFSVPKPLNPLKWTFDFLP